MFCTLINLGCWLCWSWNIDENSRCRSWSHFVCLNNYYVLFTTHFDVCLRNYYVLFTTNFMGHTLVHYILCGFFKTLVFLSRFSKNKLKNYVLLVIVFEKNRIITTNYLLYIYSDNVFEFIEFLNKHVAIHIIYP